MYLPLNYAELNLIEGSYTPSMIKAYNNRAFDFWVRSLFHRAASVIDFELPKEWSGPVRDFFVFALFARGYVAVFNSKEYGMSFQPCTLYGRDFYYQPTQAIITNPAIPESLRLEIGKECELLKLTPDYMGVFDIIFYYAEKLATMDNAINVSLINNKLAYILAAKNKAAGAALKKVLDKINQGEPAVIVDTKLLNDPDDKTEPWQVFDRPNLKQSYITTEQLQDMQTILNSFDAEIGIPAIPYQKKERMVVSEAESRVVDGAARSVVWIETLQSSIETVKKLFPRITLSAKLRYQTEKPEGGEDDGDDDSDWSL